MAILVTSDLHFFHGNILKFERLNKFRADLYADAHEMNEGIIKIWNENVKKDDEVIVVGDLCMGYSNRLEKRMREVIPQLNGKIILVRGNHDDRRGIKVLEELGHKVVHMYEHHLPSKQLVVFCHYPLVSWNKGHYGSIMMHGHCHGGYQGPGRIIDVGWDIYGKPMPLQELVDIANERRVVSIDGH